MLTNTMVLQSSHEMVRKISYLFQIVSNVSILLPLTILQPVPIISSILLGSIDFRGKLSAHTLDPPH